MARDENPPFEPGMTYYNGDWIDTNNLGGTQLEGREWLFEDVNPLTRQNRSNRYVRRRVVRNVSGVNLLPSRLVRFKNDGTVDYPSQVDGYAYNANERCYPVDEWLSPQGVPTNDLFYIVVAGPAVVLTDLAAGTDLGISVGDLVCNQSAASSGATTAGRVIQFNADMTAEGITDGNALADALANVIGRASSSNATTATNTALLIDVGKW